MEIDRPLKILAVVTGAMLLLTTYMAVFYAPLPQTSVKSADAVLSSIDGQGIQVAGFVSDVFYDVSRNFNQTMTARFSLADFSDYQRYMSAARGGQLDTEWWTVRPIDVEIHSGPSGFILATIPADLEGKNVSVMAVAAARAFGPNSNVTGHSLVADSWDAVTLGTSAGEFGVMSAPVAQKIFYFHMPSAWVAYLAFFVTLLASVILLRNRDMKYDRWAFCAAQLGVLFATIALTTGPIWAKQEWGVYWRWNDTKLVTTFVLWLVYIGYLVLRASVSDPAARARVSAVYGILGFVTVPLSLLSARVAPLLQSSHPEVIASRSGSLSTGAGITIGVAVVAFTFLFITMLIKRVEIAKAEDELEEMKREIGEEDS